MHVLTSHRWWLGFSLFGFGEALKRNYVWELVEIGAKLNDDLEELNERSS
jgi:hypothetical protein